MVRDDKGVRSIGDASIEEDDLVLRKVLGILLVISRICAVKVEGRVDVVCREALSIHLDPCTWTVVRDTPGHLTYNKRVRTSVLVCHKRAIYRRRGDRTVITLGVRAQSPSGAVFDR